MIAAFIYGRDVRLVFDSELSLQGINLSDLRILDNAHDNHATGRRSRTECFRIQGDAAYQSVPSTSKMMPFNTAAFEPGDLAGSRGKKRFVCL